VGVGVGVLVGVGVGEDVVVGVGVGVLVGVGVGEDVVVGVGVRVGATGLCWQSVTVPTWLITIRTSAKVTAPLPSMSTSGGAGGMVCPTNVVSI
jgi:hypothetical protein